MMITSHLFGIALLAGNAYSQAVSVPYCDALTKICYTSYTNSLGISFRVALPSVTKAPTDAILQIVAPISIGWAGFAWGGKMQWNPLTVAWSNKAGVRGAVASSRFAFGYRLPSPYDEAEYTYLKGTGTNATHWTVTVRCRGCSTWQANDGTNATINPAGVATFAWAESPDTPMAPADNTSSFGVHDNIGSWQHDLAGARSNQFNSWVAANILADVPIPTSTKAVSTSTFVTSTRAPTTTSAVPASSTTAANAFPTSCAGVPAAQYPSVLAKGWRAVKVKGAMTAARGVVFDSAGNLLVVESGKGITVHTVGADGCITASKTLIKKPNLSHGIVLSKDGTILYASSMTAVFKWTYDAKAQSVGTSTTVITSMYNMGHPTRSLALSPSNPNLLLVSHGSGDNFDYPSGDPKIARSVIKVFDMSAAPTGGYNYITAGYQVAYGIRNAVGLAFDSKNMLWAVENGSDEITRTIDSLASDIHTDNPADELNLIGEITAPNDKWYGYPTCYTIWNGTSITDRVFTTGDQFVLAPNATFTDANCVKSTPARLSFQAHSAPLDAKFDAKYENMYVTFHGSWDREPATGYKLVQIPFTKGSDGLHAPVAPQNSSSGYIDIWSNADTGKCGAQQCFRPVSIAFDGVGRMYVTSDASIESEMWLVGKV